jgi:transcriptional regulator with XRE-family HTH domain
VGNRLKEIRRAANISQADLAEKIGIDEEELIRIEANAQPAKLYLAFRMADALKQPVYSIFPGAAGLIDPTAIQTPEGLYHFAKEKGDELAAAGIDAHFATCSLRLSLRGGQKLTLPITKQEQQEFLFRVQHTDENNPYIRMHTLEYDLAVNTRHVIHASAMWEPIGSQEEEDTELYVLDGENRAFNFVFAVFLSGSQRPIHVDIEPDDELDEPPMDVLLSLLDGNCPIGNLVAVPDQDGEFELFNPNDIAVLAVHKSYVGGCWKDWQSDEVLAEVYDLGE